MEDKSTASGQEPHPDYKDSPAPQPINPATGQHADHWVLSEEERSKGWIRPYRTKYVHDKCGVVTRMGQPIAETYAKRPHFYGSTFCIGCNGYFPVTEFKWDGSEERVGS